MKKQDTLVLTFSDEYLVPDYPERLKNEDLTIEGKKRSNLELTVTPLED
jgi:hypothetical protein